MNKYLLLAATIAFLGVNSVFAVGQPKKGFEKYKEEFHAHRKMTHAQKVARAEETAKEWSVVAEALETTNLKSSNPAAYARVQKSVSRSETRLRNLKSGKREYSKKYYKPTKAIKKQSESFKKRAETFKQKTAARTPAKAAAAKAAAAKEATKAPGHKRTWLETLLGTEDK